MEKYKSFLVNICMFLLVIMVVTGVIAIWAFTVVIIKIFLTALFFFLVIAYLYNNLI